MFQKEDMMVSLLVAEEKVKNTEKRYVEMLEEKSKEYAVIINTMKKNAEINGCLTLFGSKFTMGEPTPHFSNGVQLFTGDEVEFPSGRKGVVTKTSKEAYSIYTNAGTADLISESVMKEYKRVFRQFEGKITAKDVKITKHFNTYEDGEEVAKGRKGHPGFIVVLKVKK